jgi:tRNA(Glu) U13 pseudouridine synthase TruD
VAIVSLSPYALFLKILQQSRSQQVRTKSLNFIIDVENLKKNGFINYFGMQRFGTYNVRTHQIGIENLHQNWIKVAHLILSQHPDGDIDQAIRKKYMIKYVFEDGNIDEALKLLERRDVLITSY